MSIKEILPLVSSFLILIIGSIIQFKIIKRQLKTSIDIHISNYRQEWINSLRETISEFISLSTWIDANRHKIYEDDSLFQEKVQQMYHQFSKIELYLNPNEKDNQDLLILIYKAVALSKQPDYDRDKLTDLFTSILDLSKVILKREWERVKKIES